VKPTNSRKKRDADDQHEQARRHREARHGRREVEDAGHHGEQHVEERRPGARIAVHAEEASERGVGGLRVGGASAVRTCFSVVR
jgi:hypothetical protein